MSAGTMYGAKFEQIDDVNGGEFTVSWIDMGYATNDEIYAAVKGGIKFSDIFEYVDPDMDANADSQGCPSDYTSINTQRGHECLKLKEGMGIMAGRLETRRYAAMLGATTEFSKWEGITYDVNRKSIFTAMSEVRGGMEDFMYKNETSDRYDLGGPNAVKVAYNPCGCVYEMNVDDSFQAYNMKALVCGKPDDSVENNACDINNIANPDNVASVEQHDGLIIGEDTGSGHQNDAIWYYDFEDGSLTRIFTTPYGSETTSPYWYPNVNGYAYMMSVVQHPYGESDQDKIGRAHV